MSRRQASRTPGLIAAGLLGLLLTAAAPHGGAVPVPVNGSGLKPAGPITLAPPGALSGGGGSIGSLPGDGYGGGAASTGSQDLIRVRPAGSGPLVSASAGGGRGSVRGRSGRVGATTGPSMGSAPRALDGWQLWWQHNRDRFLDLRGSLRENTTVSGSPALLTGRGRKHRARRGQRVDESTLRGVVVPALLEVLRESDDGEMLDSALVALARSAPADLSAEAVAACEPLLAHRELSVQAAAALALGLLDQARSQGLLLSLARDDSRGRAAVGGGQVPDRVRAHAAFAAGAAADGRGLHHLLRLVGDLPASERELAACALSGLGMEGDTRAQSVVAAVLTDLLDDRRLDPAVAATVPTALARLGRRDSLDRVVACLVDRDADLLVKQSAALALGRLARLDDAHAREQLLRTVRHDKDRLTRRFGLIALGQMGAAAPWSPAHAQLVDTLREELDGDGADREQRSWAALSLALLARAHPDAQAKALESLRAAYLDETDPDHRGAFALSLGLLDDRSMGSLLDRDLRATRDELLAGALAEALGLLRHQASADVLQEVCARPGSSESLRLSAAMALGLIGDPEAVPLLLETLANTGSLGVRAACAKALGLIGDASAVEPLVALAGDDGRSEAARAFACVSLGLLGERTRLPFLEPLKADGHYLLPVDSLKELLAIL